MVVLCFACRKKKPKYSFPLNDEYRLKKWMKILNIRKKPAKNSRLCEDHFQKRDIYCTENGKYHKVRKDALPIFRNYQEPDIRTNFSFRRKSRSAQSCSGCTIKNLPWYFDKQRKHWLYLAARLQHWDDTDFSWPILWWIYQSQ